LEKIVTPYTFQSFGDYMYFLGKKYYLHKMGYYVRDERINGKRKRLLLHREIYKEIFGSIPSGHHIHHKDGNRLNNSLENLECISASDHLSLHRKYEASVGKLDYLVKGTKIALKTAEGRKKKSLGVKKGWVTRLSVIKKCEMCQFEFETKAPQRKWCSKSCSYKNWYKNRSKA